MTSRRLTVQEASEVLGTSVDAVRMRIRRGTLESEKADDGRVYVWWNFDESVTKPRPDGKSDALISAKDQTIRVLSEQLESEREARRRADTIIAQLAQANAEQARTIRELEAPQEPEEAAETVEQEPEGTEPHSEGGKAQDELDTERARREMAETTLHEGMSEERRRREEAERERDGLRQELFALRGREEAHEKAEEQQGRGGQPQSAVPGPQGGAQPRPWWRRIIRR